MRPMIAALALVLWVTLPAWAQSASNIETLAKQGDAKAQFVLGTMYRDGQGVEKNLTETLKWWEKAAEGGYVDAQFALGDIYSGGYGVTRDYVLSYMWFDITATQTESPWLSPIARSNRDALVTRMTGDEVSKAKQLAVEWIAKHKK